VNGIGATGITRHVIQNKSLSKRYRAAETDVHRFPGQQFKLVVEDGDDLLDILEVIEAVGGVEPNQVILMAERRSAAEVAAKAPMVAGLCSEHGFRYTPRLHLDMFGGGKGVQRIDGGWIQEDRLRPFFRGFGASYWWYGPRIR